LPGCFFSELSFPVGSSKSDPEVLADLANRSHSLIESPSPVAGIAATLMGSTNTSKINSVTAVTELIFEVLVEPIRVAAIPATGEGLSMSEWLRLARSARTSGSDFEDPTGKLSSEKKHPGNSNSYRIAKKKDPSGKFNTEQKHPGNADSFNKGNKKGGAFGS